MEGAGHRIGRLRLRLKSGDPRAADAAARTFETGFEARILPALQAAFDRACPPGTVLLLDRLALDLGRLDGRQPDFGKALATALRTALGEAAGSRQTASSFLQSRQGAIVKDRPDAEADPIFDLARFLVSGMLPWPEPGGALATLVETLGTYGEARLRAAARRLLPLLIRRATARRFLAQLPQALIARLVFALAGWPGAALLAIPSGRHLTEAEVAALLPLVVRLAEAGGTAEAAAPLAGALIAPRALRPEDEAAATSLRSPALPASEPDRPAAAEASIAPEAALPVTAAGAVLLHPFLPGFFRALRVTRDDAFPDIAARERAVLLGQFLATGETTPAEPDCVLMKLLCGHPLAMPLPRRTDIGLEVRTEAEALLQAAISHWRQLGSTTPRGLREGFLLRPGVLCMSEAAAILRVERRGIDVLLDSLPWTISQVKTPFMDRILAVDWA
jgi:hypothetical protein